MQPKSAWLSAGELSNDKRRTKFNNNGVDMAVRNEGGPTMIESSKASILLKDVQALAQIMSTMVPLS